MGLDMYLEEVPAGLMPQLEAMTDETGSVDDRWYEARCGDMRQTGYWCKANVVHEWFVRNVPGVKSGGAHVMPYDALQQLKKDCEDVLSGQVTAEELMPVADPGFDGNEEYGYYYMQSLENTVRIIKRLRPGGVYLYAASW